MTIKKLRNTIIYITLYTLLPGYLSSQNYASPMDIPLSLSANMGELRNNHFHSGIDIKTQRVENKKMFAIADGYVSRISISPSGYGLAICIDHPETGHTSVYGHVNGFSPEIEKYVKEQQYEQERYKVDLRPSKNQFIVKRGQFIGYSGNTGSSFGPHIHFEIRNTKTQMVLDPLVYYKDRIKDTVAPEIRGLAFYPQEGVGVINNSSLPYRIAIRKNKKNEYLPLKDTITAWGRIGIGVKAYDRMNGATNVYGVKLVKLFLDGKEIFSSDITSYSFDQTRMINSFADFAAWRNSNQWFMKSFIEPGNKLPFYKAVDNGYINIDREKTYSLKYILTDLYGNSLSYNFVIKGKKQPVFDEKKCSLFMHWDRDNRFIDEDFSLIIPTGNLYFDFCFTMKKSVSETYLSERIRLNTTPIPLDKRAKLAIKLKVDTLSNKSQYGIVRVNKGRDTWFGGVYNNGYIETSIRELGAEYAVYFDTVAPELEPVLEKNWMANKNIRIRVTDNQSGIKSVKGTIDGKFVLFKNDIKSPIYSYKFDDERIVKNKNHTLILVATDNCGNTAEYKYEFFY